MQARRLLIVCAIVIAAGVAGILALILPSDEERPTPVVAQPVAPPASAPVTVLPAPASPSTRTATPVKARRPAPVVDLNIGTTVGLEANGLRLRHRNFTGRVDRIGPRSRDLDKADSRFVVRKGLARDGCVSLESVNYPGYFLRHRDFVLHLDERDGQELFIRDATFCLSPTRDGTAFFLESINFPGRTLTVHPDGVIRLDPGATTPFVARSPF